MEVGILTYHRTLNHGACLQAVATRLLLERLGHKVYYVDYWPKYHADSYKLFSFERFLKLSFRKKLGYLKSLLSYINYTKRRSAFHPIRCHRYGSRHKSLAAWDLPRGFLCCYASVVWHPANGSSRRCSTAPFRHAP